MIELILYVDLDFQSLNILIKQIDHSDVEWEQFCWWISIIIQVLHHSETSSAFVIINFQYAFYCKFTYCCCYNVKLKHISCHHQKIYDSIKNKVYL